MGRILFVDDDPRVLAALRASLWRRRRQWEMVFVGSGGDALEHLARDAFDILVADLRMAPVDGVELLETVSIAYPEVGRIMLSGEVGIEQRFAAMHVSHQFLGKPCPPGLLDERLSSILQARARLTNSAARRATGANIGLPSPSIVCARLQAALDDSSIGKIARTIESDIAMTARLLQVVNSNYFGVSRNISDVDEAVQVLGVDTIRSLALTHELDPADDRDVDTLTAHARVTRDVCSGLLASTQLAEDTQHRTAALLHDVGRLVIRTQLPQMYRATAEVAKREGRPVATVEYEHSGFSHAEVGAYLLSLWGLPPAVVGAAAHHHQPAHAPNEHFELAAAIHVADYLASELVAARS